MITATPNFWYCSIPEIQSMRYAKVSHVLYQSCFISDMLNMNNSKNQKQLMPIIPNINNCKCQSFWRSEMSNFNNVNVNCAQYQLFKVPKLTSISFNLINRVKYQLCQSQKWQYHLCGDELCARPFLSQWGYLHTFSLFFNQFFWNFKLLLRRRFKWLFWQIGCARCTRSQHSAVHTVHCFPNFLFFMLMSCNLLCRHEIRFHNSCTLFFEK